MVRYVIDVSIEDEANIGWYDVNQLQYDPATEKLRLVSSALAKSSFVAGPWTSSFSVGDDPAGPIAMSPVPPAAGKAPGARQRDPGELTSGAAMTLDLITFDRVGDATGPVLVG